MSVDCPVSKVSGSAANVTTLGGGGRLVTVTLTELAALAPPGPVQVKVYV
jgi:hypothetical protein